MHMSILLYQVAWSHQLRINANGRLEHYLEADDRYTVSHTVPVTPGSWHHVAGVAVADGEMKLMVDGQEEVRSSYSGEAAVGSRRQSEGSHSV